jgi:hypothetical protein
MRILVVLVGVLASRPAFANSVGGIDAIRQVFAVAGIAVALILGFMALFIVLSVALGRRLRAAASAGGLVKATRVLAGAWYLCALVPAGLSLGRSGWSVGEAGWMLVLVLIVGLPAHIPSLIALVRAARLARLRGG